MAKKLIEEDLRLNILVNGDAGKKAALDAAKTFDELGKKLENAKKELSAIDAGLRPQGYENAKKKVQDLNASYEIAQQRMESLNRQQQIETMTLGELQRHIKLTSIALRDAIPGTEQWELLNKELNDTKNRLKELRTGGVQTEGVLKRLSNSAAGAVAILGAVWMAVSRVANAFRSAFNTIKDFEQPNANLATILGQEVDTIYDLTNQALKLGQTTRYTASEVTNLQTELAKLGFTQRQILQMTESVLNFATAVGSELPESAALAGATLRMFGLQAGSTDDVMATLALSTNKSALNFSYLQTAMSIVGPVAKTFGFGVKDTTALLGTLANAGFDASSAATATRNIILNLADANGKLAKALGEPIETFPDLIDGLKKLNDQGVDLATTLELTDKRSVAAFNAFLSGADSAKILREELEDTDGVLQDIAEKRMNTVEGSVASLQSAWERFVLSLRNSQGTIKKTIDLLTDLVRGITPGEETDPNATARRTSSYIGSLWNMYSDKEDGVSLILQAIADDEKKMEQGLKNAEAKLESASGIIAKRRAKKEVQYYKEGVAMMAGARQEFTDRQQWEAGTFSEESGSGSGSGNGSGNGGGGGGGSKGKKTWSLQSDEGFLASKTELTRQYNEGQIKSQEEFEERLYLLEISSLQARLNLHKESGADRQKIEADIQDKTMALNAKVQKSNEERARKEADERKEAAKLEEQALQARISAADNYNEKAELQLKAENARFEKELKQYEAKKDLIANYNQVVETLERQHANNLRKIELERLTAEMKELESAHKHSLAQIQQDSEYELQLETTSSARRLQIQKDRNKAIAEENLRFAQEQYRFLQSIVSSGEIAGVALSKEQLVQYKQQLEEVKKQLQDADAALKNLTTSSVFSGTGDGSLFGVNQKDWETFFSNLADGTLKAKDLQVAINGIGGAAQEGYKLASQAMQLTAAKEKKALDTFKNGQDDRKKELEARFKAGLMTEHQYNEAVEQMEADMQAKQEEMELREAMRTKKMSIIESIINTALGVTKTLAQWGIPAGIAPAAIMTAMGAAQTAMIAAQPVGYAEGGDVQVKRAQDGKTFKAKVEPDKRGYVDKPTILVGEEGGEYVIPADGLKNPDIRNMADIIENARRTGQLRSLRMEVVSPAYAVAGRADGGYTQETLPAGSVVLPSGATIEISRLAETVDRLSSILDAGIVAEVVMLGKNGLIERLDEYNRAKKRGQL